MIKLACNVVSSSTAVLAVNDDQKTMQGQSCPSGSLDVSRSDHLFPHAEERGRLISTRVNAHADRLSDFFQPSKGLLVLRA